MKKPIFYLSVTLLLGILLAGCKKDPDELEPDNTPDFADFEPYVANQSQIKNVFYVDGTNASASNDNPGTEDLPWKTVDFAAKNIGAGSKVIVKTGVYEGSITIDVMGEADGPVIFEASGEVTINNIVITGNYISIYGFKVQKPAAYDDWRNSGIFIAGDYCHIDKNTILGFTSQVGIRGAWGNNFTNNIHLSNNYIYQCNAGIHIYGNKWYVVNNEIERLFRDADGFDADNMRYFGDTIVIKNNYMHGTIEGEIGASHVDLFQTYPNNGEIAHNVLIKKNIGVGYFHQAMMLSGDISRKSHKNLWVVQNVFANGISWGICANEHVDINVCNNVIIDGGFHGIGFRTGCTGIVENNIIVNWNSGYWKDDASSYTSGWNLLNHDTRTYNNEDFSTTDLLNLDPLFVNPDDIVGADGKIFTDDDGLQLKDNSPAKGAGEDGKDLGAY